VPQAQKAALDSSGLESLDKNGAAFNPESEDHFSLPQSPNPTPEDQSKQLPNIIAPSQATATATANNSWARTRRDTSGLKARCLES
jgi:hypothetical protein